MSKDANESKDTARMSRRKMLMQAAGVVALFIVCGGSFADDKEAKAAMVEKLAKRYENNALTFTSAPLPDVFKIISEAAGVEVIVPDHLRQKLNERKHITLNLRGFTWGCALGYVTEAAGLGFQVDAKGIVLCSSSLSEAGSFVNDDNKESKAAIMKKIEMKGKGNIKLTGAPASMVFPLAAEMVPVNYVILYTDPQSYKDQPKITINTETETFSVKDLFEKVEEATGGKIRIDSYAVVLCEPEKIKK